jgi:hypothetical protein
MDLKLLYLICNIVSMEQVMQFIGFLKSLGYVVIDYFIDFASMVLCIVCDPKYVFCFCCGKEVETVCKKFYIVLCDDCKVAGHSKLFAIANGHGLYIPHLALLKI